jgi:hypothetical protein
LPILPQRLKPQSFCDTYGTAEQAAEKVFSELMSPAETGSSQHNRKPYRHE